MIRIVRIALIFLILHFVFIPLLITSDQNTSIRILKIYNKDKNILLKGFSLKVLYSDKNGRVCTLSLQDNDNDGAVQLDNNIVGRVTILAQGEYGIFDDSLVLDTHNREVCILCVPGVQITGKVIDDKTKRPIKGAVVNINPYSKRRYNNLEWVGVTNNDGEYTIYGVVPDFYPMIKVIHPLYIKKTTSAFLKEDTNFSFSLDKKESKPNVNITGIVYDGDSNLPLKDVTICLRSFGFYATTTTNENGIYTINETLYYYDFSDWEPSFYISKIGFYTVKLNINFTEGVDTKIEDIYLIRCGYVSGCLFNARNKEPLINALISVYYLNGTEVVNSSYTNKKGEYLINCLSDGSYRVKVGDIKTDQIFEIKDRLPVKDFDIKVLPFILKGTIYDEDGFPIVGAWIDVGCKSLTKYYDDGDFITNESGNFVINEIINSSLKIEIKCPYTKKKLGIEDDVSFNSTHTEVNRKYILFDGESISGLVTTKEGKPLLGYIVAAWYSTKPIVFTRTDIEGRYELILPKGIYDIKVENPIDETQEKGKQSIPTNSTNIDFCFE